MPRTLPPLRLRHGRRTGWGTVGRLRAIGGSFHTFSSPHGRSSAGPCVLVPSAREIDMQYAILCYHSEDVVCAWSKEEDAAVMARLKTVHEPLAAAGKLGPVARLMPTTAATTLRKDQDPPLVLDGPFAETKEQLLGFYVVDCENLDEV